MSKARRLASRVRTGLADRVQRKVVTRLARAKLEAERGTEAGDNLLFVTGFDKSGTTWLRLLLDSHPEVVCRGHGQFFNFYREGEPYIQFSGGYREMTDSLFETAWWNRDGSVWMTENMVRQDAARLIADALRSYSTTSSRLVGAKGTIQDCELIRDVYPNSRIIGIVRDGRDVAVSFAYHFSRQEGKRSRFTADGRIEREYLDELAEGWSQYVLHMAKQRDHIYTVRYEDLLQNTSSVLAGALAYLGVAHDAATVDAIVQKNAFERLSGGRKRGEQDASSFYRKGVAGDWRTHLNDEDRARFAEIAGTALETWGYEC